MEDAFGTLVWVVAAVGAIVAVLTLVGTARSYEQIGGGGIVHDEDDAGDGARATTAERDDEIRQLLEARNARRARRGEARRSRMSRPSSRRSPTRRRSSTTICARRFASTWLPAMRAGYERARRRLTSTRRSSGGSAS